MGEYQVSSSQVNDDSNKWKCVVKLSIGRFAQKCGVSVETIRYYHREGLLPVPAKAGAMRLYGEREYQTFAFIRNAKECGLSLRSIKNLLEINDKQNADSCKQIQGVFSSQLSELQKKLEQLQRVTNSIQCMMDQCESCDSQKCAMLERLSALPPSTNG